MKDTSKTDFPALPAMDVNSTIQNIVHKEKHGKEKNTSDC